MNETILNGLLNLFAIFTSLAKIETGQARNTIVSYLTCHLGIHSHKEYLNIFDEIQKVYSDPDIRISKENVIINVCKQLKPKLKSKDQGLLLLRFMEFAHNNDNGLNRYVMIFQKIAEIFDIEKTDFEHLYAFIVGKTSSHILTINSHTSSEEGNHIYRKGLEGNIRVLELTQFGQTVFTYQGNESIYINDTPLTPGLFYSWRQNDVIKSPFFLPVYYCELLEVFNPSEQKNEIILSGREIEFQSKGNSKGGIHNFSFDLKSGQLVAIMGGNNKDKSTLLNLLNGTLIPQKGKICLNGHPIHELKSKSLIGFVPQEDVLIEDLTVYQNLWYAARLCLANLSRHEIKDRILALLKDLDLLEIKDQTVGAPNRKNLGEGERKRLNIALELIREPDILFVDEPTLGLSPFDSEKIILLLKEQTYRGRLVVISVQQPSTEIYKLFDHLWLLDSDGYPIYDGDPTEAINYLKQIALYTNPDTRPSNSCRDINPEQILLFINAKKIDDEGIPTSMRKMEPEEWHKLYLSNRPKLQEIKSSPLPANPQKKSCVLSQFRIFLGRTFRTKLANKKYLGIALLAAPILALIVALLTRYKPDENYLLVTNKNLVTYIFLSVIMVTFIGLNISAEEILKDQTSFIRDRFLRLSRGSYLFSKIFYLFCLSAIQSLLFTLIGNVLIRIGWEMFPAWWIMLWATAFLANLTSLLVSQSMRSVTSIYVLIPFLLIPQILLSGAVIRFDDMSKMSAQRNIVPPICEIIPSRWAFEALVTEQYRNNSYKRLLFQEEKDNYLAHYYFHVHADVVRNLITSSSSSPEEQKDKFQTIHNELNNLADIARIPPYAEEEEYTAYLNRVKKALRTHQDSCQTLLENKKRYIIHERGSKWLNTLKNEHHNTALEQLVINSNTSNLFQVAHNHIYPKIGQIYFEPENHWGLAPFYSHEKKLGDRVFPTYLFNLMVLGCFSLLIILAILADFPGRFLRKKD